VQLLQQQPRPGQQRRQAAQDTQHQQMGATEPLHHTEADPPQLSQMI
jgi:hypothetical protein